MIKKFSDVVDVVNGKSQKKVENPNGHYPIYGSGGLMGYADDYICEANTVIIGRKGNINTPIYVEKPFWNVDTAFGLVAKQDFLLPKYLYYFCQNFNFEKLNTTVTIPSLTKANLLKIEIEIPDIREQEDVVKKLESVVKLMEMQKVQIDLCDALVQSRFVEMFGDPVLNTKKWDSCSVIEKCGCMVPGRDKPKSFSGDIPWITIEDLIVNGTTYGSKSNLGLTESEIKEVNRKTIPAGSVIISCVGNLGICSIAGTEMIINQQLHSFQCNDEINNMFLMYYLGHRKDYMQKNASNTTVLYMNKTVCNSIPIIVPPIDLQNEFADFVEQVNKMKFEIQKSLDETQTLMDSLMQEYFG